MKMISIIVYIVFGMTFIQGYSNLEAGNII